MGVFDFWKGSSPEDKRAEEVRSGARAPDRTERKRCWEARDGYFACLDRAGVLDAIKDDAAAAKACRAEGAQFERDCAAEWVSGPLPLLSWGSCILPYPPRFTDGK